MSRAGALGQGGTLVRQENAAIGTALHQPLTAQAGQDLVWTVGCDTPSRAAISTTRASPTASMSFSDQFDIVFGGFNAVVASDLFRNVLLKRQAS